MDIRFEVLPKSYVYLGTLQANGTKEKIKLGGVPVIKPGFEYTAEVIDEKEEGIAFFKQRFPDIKDKVVVQLMEYRQFVDVKKDN